MDSESSQVISFKLVGPNYTNWAYLMKNYLVGKEVWKYVDGTVKKPEEGIANYAELLFTWNTVNARIVTWINNTVDPAISKHLAKSCSAKEVWDHLARVFTRMNIARKCQLENYLLAIVQGDTSIQEFYSLMTRLWDQLAMMEPPELTSLDCYIKFREEQRLVQFLVALRPEFEPVRRQILLRSPLPSVADAVNVIITEEARLPMSTIKQWGSYRRVNPRLIPNPALPDEMIWEILTWIPTKSLMRCKCVSKLWRSIIMDPSFARLYRGGFRGLLISEPYDWRKESRRVFYYLSLFDGPVKYLSHHLTLDHNGKIMGCTDTVNGLLCFYYSNYSYLYNIATRERRKLPVSRHEANSCSYHLGFDPISKLYKLLKICPIYKDYDDDYVFPEQHSEFVRNLECEILTLGVDSSWRNINSAPCEIASRSVCLNGVLYWMEDNLIAFHLSQEEFQFLPATDPECYNLLQFGPGLALVQVRIISYKREAVISHYDRGVWTEQIFDLPPSSRRHFRPIGILPDGKVLMFDENKEITSTSTFYVYDPTKGNIEKTVICKSPSSSVLKQEGILGYKSYHEENIIPLSCLTASP